MSREDSMHSTISKLLGTYESGKLSRRDLVQGLALLVASAAGSGTASAAGFQVESLNHVSLLVSDLQRSADFYKGILGVSVDKRGVEMMVTLGKNRLVLREGKPAGTVDHIGISVEPFMQDAVAAELKARGTASQVGNRPGPGFHFLDPDGFPIQLQASRE
jgi:catechol 2,3-dioxygenase-like lactoylglutathione lyase family enzyme